MAIGMTKVYWTLQPSLEGTDLAARQEQLAKVKSHPLFSYRNYREKEVCAEHAKTITEETGVRVYAAETFGITGLF